MNDLFKRLKAKTVEEFSIRVGLPFLEILRSERKISKKECDELLKDGANSWERQILWAFGDDDYKIEKVHRCLKQVRQTPDLITEKIYDEFILRQGAMYLLKTLISERKENAELRKLIAEVHGIVEGAPEINSQNLDHDDLISLNEAMTSVWRVLNRATREGEVEETKEVVAS